jgi:hypothetical protein
MIRGSCTDEQQCKGRGGRWGRGGRGERRRVGRKEEGGEEGEVPLGQACESWACFEGTSGTFS